MNYTNTDYRKRIANVKYANSVVKTCLRRMHIHDYIPGQVIYNLGEYPCASSGYKKTICGLCLVPVFSFLLSSIRTTSVFSLSFSLNSV